MSSNVGLSTPRGSGTSGYVQKNMSFLRPKQFDNRNAPYPEDRPHQMRREPNREILEHDRKREVEVKCFELRDRLEEEDKLTEEEIDEEVDALRKKLLAELGDNLQVAGAGGKRLKEWETHEIAARKIEENDRFERAIGLKRDGNMGPPRRQWDRGTQQGRREDGPRNERRSRSPDEGRRRDRYERRDRSTSRERVRDRSRTRSRSRSRDRRGYYDRDDVKNYKETRERERSP